MTLAKGRCSGAVRHKGSSGCWTKLAAACLLDCMCFYTARRMTEQEGGARGAKDKGGVVGKLEVGGEWT